jgi:hypothetical protein
MTDRSCYSVFMAKGEATRDAILDKALSMATQTGLEGLTKGSRGKDAPALRKITGRKNWPVAKS